MQTSITIIGAGYVFNTPADESTIESFQVADLPATGPGKAVPAPEQAPVPVGHTMTNGVVHQ